MRSSIHYAALTIAKITHWLWCCSTSPNIN